MHIKMRVVDALILANKHLAKLDLFRKKKDAEVIGRWRKKLAKAECSWYGSIIRAFQFLGLMAHSQCSDFEMLIYIYGDNRTELFSYSHFTLLNFRDICIGLLSMKFEKDPEIYVDQDVLEAVEAIKNLGEYNE